MSPVSVTKAQAFSSKLMRSNKELDHVGPIPWVANATLGNSEILQGLQNVCVWSMQGRI